MSGRKLFLVVTAAVFCGMMLFAVASLTGFSLSLSSQSARMDERADRVALENLRKALATLDEHLAKHPDSPLQTDRADLVEKIRKMESERR